MYRLNPDWRLQAEELAELWRNYMHNRALGKSTVAPVNQHVLTRS
jgi:hypothetical protein